MLKERYTNYIPERTQIPLGEKILYATKTIEGHAFGPLVLDAIHHDPHLKGIVIIGPTGVGKSTLAAALVHAINRKFGNRVEVRPITAESVLNNLEEELTQITLPPPNRMTFTANHWQLYNNDLVARTKEVVEAPIEGPARRVITLLDVVAVGKEEKNRGADGVIEIVTSYPGQFLVAGVAGNPEIVSVASGVRSDIERFVKMVRLRTYGISPSPESLSSIQLNLRVARSLPYTREDFRTVRAIQKKWGIHSGITPLEFIEHTFLNALPANLDLVHWEVDELGEEWIAQEFEENISGLAEELKHALPQNFPIVEGRELYARRILFMEHWVIDKFEVPDGYGKVLLVPKLEGMVSQYLKLLKTQAPRKKALIP